MTKTAKILALISLVVAAQIAASAATQTIAFDAIPNQIFGVSPFPIVAQASSGLPVSLTSTTPAICKTASGLVMLLSAGPCFITASQAGNATYDPATSVTQSFTVSQGKPAASFGFLNPTTVATRPYAITVGDFNNDGIPDMATASQGAIPSPVGAVTVLIGNGMGGFTATAGSPITVGQSPVSIVTGDFNADGNADLAVANANDSTVTVLLGNGAGAFSPATGSPFATDAGPVSIVAGDFNGDGIEDLATANQAGNDVTILLGNGLGGFTRVAGTPPTVDTTPFSMVVADFNADGFQDLAVANGYTISVLLGNGSGGFTAATGSPFSLEAVALAVSDFNGDGIPDLAATNPFQSIVPVYLGNGAGGFAPASGSPFSVGSFPFETATTSVAVGDFNGDGFADIAVGLYSGNVVTVLAGNGSGGFTAGGTFGVFFFEEEPIALATGDFNRDGIEDFAVAYQQNSLAAVWLGAHVSTTSVLSTTSPLTVDAGQSVALSAALSYQSVDFSAFTGTVTFMDGTTVLGTSSQTASPYLFTAANLGVGSHTLTAVYSGDTRSLTSTSNSITIQVIVPLAQSITFAPLPNIPVAAAPFTLAATSDSGLTVAFTSNTPTVCTVSGATLTILIAGGCSITATQPGSTVYAAAIPVTQRFTVLFSDVAPTDFDYAEINTFAQLGITNGCGSNNFCPNQNVTRDEMAIFVVRAIYGSDNFTYTTTPYFTDVQPATFGFKWIQKLKDLGITNGCTATNYCPGDVVTRDEMAIFIIRARLGVNLAGSTPAFTYPSTPYFTDATADNEFAFPWIQRMKLDSITSGCTATTYCPFDPVTRGETAIFIMRGAFNQYLPAGTPVITQISPSTITSGTSGTYTITGANTNFVQGTTQLSPIPGITIGTITVTSATTLTVQLTDAGGVPTQPQSVLAITGSEQAVLPNGLVLQ